MDGVHDLGARGDSCQRKAAGNALRRRDHVGNDSLVLTGKPGAGAAEAGLDLVGHEHDAVGAGEVDQRG